MADNRDMEELLQNIFQKLNKAVDEENNQRREDGTHLLARSKVVLLGQLSLLVDKKLSAVLHLAATADMDAKLEMDYFVKKELKDLLEENGLVYDEDSDKIFIPKNSRELDLFEFKNIVVKRLDPESVLVSKAVKAPEKNLALIQMGTASLLFPNLISRIEKEGGNLEKIFGEDKDE